MTDNSGTVREEIDDYIIDLTQKRHDLVNFQMGRPADSLLIPETQVVVMAIDGMLEKLKTPDLLTTVNLDVIVKISTDVQNIKTSANRLLAKR